MEEAEIGDFGKGLTMCGDLCGKRRKTYEKDAIQVIHIFVLEVIGGD